MDNRPIGIFDSGIGGLTVLYELQKIMPNEKYIFFGDTKNVPYGDKRSQEIIEFSNKIVSFLLTYNVKLCVIACNSIATTALCHLEKKYNVKFISITKSGIKSILKNNLKKVCLIATKKTIETNMYETHMQKIKRNITVINVATPQFALIVENGEVNTSISKKYVYEYLGFLKDENIDAIVLGCTHYPFLIEDIKEIIGDIEIINPSIQCAIDSKNYLCNNNLNGNNEKEIKIFITGDLNNFTKMKDKYFGEFIAYKPIKHTFE